MIGHSFDQFATAPPTAYWDVQIGIPILAAASFKSAYRN
jgi:hypothetical protein